MSSPSPKPPARILVLSLAGIGDTLMATPVLRELRVRFPDAAVEVAVLWAGSEQVLRHNPHVSAVHRHDFIRASAFASLAFVQRLARRGYDASLTLHPQGRRAYRVITRLVGAPRRLSHRYENHSWIDTLLVNETVAQDYNVSCASNNLRLVDLLGPGPRSNEAPAYGLFLSEEERAWAARLSEGLGLAGTRWLGVHVGSGGTKNLALRRWPVHRWRELLARLRTERPGLRVVAFGGPGEADAHRELSEAVPELVVPDFPDIRHAAALLAGAHAFASVDTAFMHLAAAVAVPNQFVVETPTLNIPVEPLRRDWTRIPNPAVRGRPLDFYRYDGRPIAGSPSEIRWMMEAVTADAVLGPLLRVL